MRSAATLHLSLAISPYFSLGPLHHGSLNWNIHLCNHLKVDLVSFDLMNNLVAFEQGQSSCNSVLSNRKNVPEQKPFDDIANVHMDARVAISHAHDIEKFHTNSYKSQKLHHMTRPR